MHTRDITQKKPRRKELTAEVWKLTKETNSSEEDFLPKGRAEEFRSPEKSEKP